MFNVFRIKKYAAFSMAGILPIIFWICCLFIMGDLLYAIVFAFLGIIMSTLIGVWLIRHPLLETLENKGFMVQNFDSSGVIDPFLVQVQPPFISGIYRRKQINSFYNRDIVIYFKPPKKCNLAKGLKYDRETGTYEETDIIELPKEKEKLDTMFSFSGVPTFVFNKNLGVFLSKDVLSNTEKDTMIKHVVLYLLRKTESLSEIIRDFARHVVEQMRPKKLLGGWAKWILIAVVVVFIIIFILLALPTFLQNFGSAVSPGGGGVSIP